MSANGQRLTAAEIMLPFSAGVWQHGFEFQSRYIALRIRAGEISPVIRGAVWRLFHLSKSQEKSKKNVRNVPITVRLNEEESRHLKNNAAACGLSVAEFMRQLCSGNAPQPQPKKEFWELLNTLYEVHAAFKKCVPYFPSASEICKEIEQLTVDLQQKFTMPQPFDMEKYIRKGAV